MDTFFFNCFSSWKILPDSMLAEVSRKIAKHKRPKLDHDYHYWSSMRYTVCSATQYLQKIENTIQDFLCSFYFIDDSPH